MWTRAVVIGWLVLVGLMLFTPLGSFWLYAVLSPNLLANVIAWGFALVPFILLLRHIAAKLCALRQLGRSIRV
ncbi:hypothetical protein FVQ98_13510 [Ottowia sp. GY511]|uniref:DUF2842 domain-containing protein n=1 Tax=Ottowia flava TaxID=2675430 RepID=A0ABW4KV62_9BURK|nr:hypothetical protein [Ottowia sp. GY511]TXK26642.1 hypothetical protein FVQ98_13510 [Ottowia sp. GY511]